MKQNRADRVIAELKKQGVTQMLITDPMSVYYLTDVYVQPIREINTEASVIATGGSAIFSEEAMKHLGEQGLIVYLDVSCEEIIRRVNNISTRGIAMKPGKTLADLYEERKPYYEKYAQLTIPCDGKTMEQCVQAIALAVDNPVRMC